MSIEGGGEKRSHKDTKEEKITKKKGRGKREEGIQ
jgi:hypothetical protein